MLNLILTLLLDRVLDLSDNKIGWKGIVNLADAIANKNSVLTSLIIQKNKFGISKEVPRQGQGRNPIPIGNGDRDMTDLVVPE